MTELHRGGAGPRMSMSPLPCRPGEWPPVCTGHAAEAGLPGHRSWLLQARQLGVPPAGGWLCAAPAPPALALRGHVDAAPQPVGPPSLRIPSVFRAGSAAHFQSSFRSAPLSTLVGGAS